MPSKHQVFATKFFALHSAQQVPLVQQKQQGKHL